MTQPQSYGGRPLPPPPGAPTPELRVARFRPHARHLAWSALVLIAVAAATGYFFNNLPSPFENWMLLLAAAGTVLLLVVLPYLAWLAHSVTITTRRVVQSRGFLGRNRTELTHARGYTIAERRGVLQRLWGAGNLTLSNGVDAPLRLMNVPAVRLVHEVLADQVEVSQILAHRDSNAIPTLNGSQTDRL